MYAFVDEVVDGTREMGQWEWMVFVALFSFAQAMEVGICCARVNLHFLDMDVRSAKAIRYSLKSASSQLEFSDDTMFGLFERLVECCRRSVRDVHCFRRQSRNVPTTVQHVAGRMLDKVLMTMIVALIRLSCHSFRIAAICVII